ncbi:unnamed protein product [Brassica napus]|uniref:(rape) hypothetical protein n=1 Tax=Brassica napus TaxID=3708 RepID=A0A816I2T8_BRANA|nr:unnamed protein product [Brassica napus]
MIICFISMFTFKRSLWSLVGSSHSFDLKLIKFAFTLIVLKIFVVVVVVVVMW